jgi:hypothetical protein
MESLEGKEPEAVMVPQITITALSPAFHFPLRYNDFIWARAAATDAAGLEESDPEAELLPPAETYQVGF